MRLPECAGLPAALVSALQANSLPLPGIDVNTGERLVRTTGISSEYLLFLHDIVGIVQTALPYRQRRNNAVSETQSILDAWQHPSRQWCARTATKARAFVQRLSRNESNAIMPVKLRIIRLALPPGLVPVQPPDCRCAAVKATQQAGRRFAPPLNLPPLISEFANVDHWSGVTGAIDRYLAMYRHVAGPHHSRLSPMRAVAREAGAATAVYEQDRRKPLHAALLRRWQQEQSHSPACSPPSGEISTTGQTAGKSNVSPQEIEARKKRAELLALRRKRCEVGRGQKRGRDIPC